MKKALLTGINDYAGQANDLRGCVNDVKNWAKILPGFEVKMLLNSEVTNKRFHDEFLNLVLSAERGDMIFLQYSGHGTQVPDKSGDEPDGYDEALYLFDGPFTDDSINWIISQKKDGVLLIIAFDSCFSGTGTRDMDKILRFHPLSGEPEYKPRKIRRRGIIRNSQDYIYLSGCAENQTSADARINGEYNGAFSYYACKNYKPGLTYKEWHSAYVKAVRRNGYEQIPQLEGCCELFQSPVFGTEKRKCFLKFWQ